MTPNSIFTTGVCVKYTAVAFFLGPTKGIFEKKLKLKRSKEEPNLKFYFEMQSHFCDVYKHLVALNYIICYGREFTNDKGYYIYYCDSKNVNCTLCRVLSTK